MDKQITVLQELFHQGKWGPARSLAQRLTLHQPDAEIPWQILTIAQDKLGDTDAARVTATEAAHRFPDSLASKRNLFALLRRQGMHQEANRVARAILRQTPDDLDLYYELIFILILMAEFDEAFHLYDEILPRLTDHPRFLDKWLLDINFHPDKTAEEIAAAYQDYERRITAPLYVEQRPHSNNPDPHRRLKVGYVSQNFYPPALGLFMEPWLTAHDHQQFEIYAYVTETEPDFISTRIRQSVDHWIVIKDLDDAAFVEQVRNDGIDILVDIAGHLNHNRLRAFARKPAPVSLSWWILEACTTGVSAIDYLLIDRNGAPDGTDALFAEQPWRLDGPSCVYRPPPDIGPVSPSPALANGYVTFCSLTRSVRLNHRVIRAWSDILKQCPKARLVIDSQQFAEPSFCTLVLDRFRQHGITEDRLEIGYHTPPWDILRRTDITLDPFPFSSGTTIMHGLYMGHPVITLRGRVSTGRIGSHHVAHAGHSEWIADTEEEYVAKAVNLAQNLPELAAIRASLRQDLETGPLMNYVDFTARVETAYRHMWERWCAQHTT